MPAKRKDSAKDDSARQAEVDAQRMREEEERRQAEAAASRQASDEAKQRAEEEKRRVEIEKRKEEEIKRAREEEERRHREKEKELQQIQLLEEKDKELHSLKEKLYTLNKSHASLQAELEKETRRVAQLTNELELAQIKLIDGETALKRREKEWVDARDALRQENEHLKGQLGETSSQLQNVSGANDELRSRLGIETDTLRQEVTQIRTDKDRDDTENTILMKLLQTELDKHKQLVAQLQEQVEGKDRDEVKNTIMMGLLNSQLEAGREEARRLRDTIDDSRTTLRSTEEKLEATNKSLLDQSTAHDAYSRAASEKETQLLREVDVHRRQASTLTTQVQQLTEQLDSAKVHFTTFQKEADRRDKEAFETNVILRAELDHTKKTLKTEQDEHKRSDEESFSRHTIQTAEIDSLKQRIAHLLETGERKEKDSFETITLLNAEVETLKSKLQLSNEQRTAGEKEAFEKQTALQLEIDTGKTSMAQQKHTAERKEKDYFEQLTRLTAENDSLNRSVLNLQTSSERRDKDYVNATVLLNAEKESLKVKAASLEEALSTKASQHDKYATAALEKEAELKRQLDTTRQADEAALNAETEKLRAATQAVEQANKRIASLEAEHAKKDKENWDRINALKAEQQAVYTELDAAKQTIERLEGSIAENYNFKLLAEQNEILKADLQSYKNQVAHLNNTIATLKIEADILDNYKTKVLQEQNEQYARRLQQQEKEQRLLQPLMNEMVSTLQRHGLASSLQADIDQYRHLVAARMQAAETPPSSPPRMTASAMGRRELSSLTTVHSLKEMHGGVSS